AAITTVGAAVLVAVGTVVDGGATGRRLQAVVTDHLISDREVITVVLVIESADVPAEERIASVALRLVGEQRVDRAVGLIGNVGIESHGTGRALAEHLVPVQGDDLLGVGGAEGAVGAGGTTAHVAGTDVAQRDARALAERPVHLAGELHR